MKHLIILSILLTCFTSSGVSQNDNKSKHKSDSKDDVTLTSSSGVITFNILPSTETEYLSFYSTEIEQEKDQSGLFKPRGEFEKKEVYAARQQQANDFSKQLNRKYRAKYKTYLQDQEIALHQKIKSSYTQISLGVDNVSSYDPDEEFFSIQIGNYWSKVKVPLIEAETFKINGRKAKVTADRQLKEDGQTFDTFNIRIIHPITNNSYTFSTQRSPLYLSQIPHVTTQSIGVPDMKTSVIFIEPSGNKLLDANERASIEITLTNNGSGPAKGIHTLINPASYPHIQINKPVEIPNIERGQSIKTIVELVAGPRLPSGEINFNFSFSEDQYFQPHPFNVTIQTQGLKPPKIDLKEYGIKETTGNLNNVIERGEVVAVTAVLENTGKLSAENLQAFLLSDDPDIRIINDKDNPSVYKLNNLQPGETRSMTFSFALNNRYSGTSTLPLKLGILHDDLTAGASLPLKLTMGELNTAVENLKFTGIYGEEGLGKNYALFFAVNDYDNMTDLQSPISDAQAVAKELEDRFGFNTEVVKNPTFEMIDQKIIEYKDKFERNFNNQYYPSGQLLIFFSGHGVLENKVGYFMPKDVRTDRLRTTAIQYPIYQKLIDEINCRHILVMIDACFSGTFDETLTRNGGDLGTRPGEPDTRQKILNEHFKYQTRLYLTSGAKVETPDKSNFVKGILEALRTHKSPEKLFSAQELYGTYLEKVVPKPLFGEFGKNERGSTFLFMMKER